MPSASSCFIRDLQLSGDGKAFKVMQEKSPGSGYLHCSSMGCKIWAEKLSGVYFSTENFDA